MLERRLPANIVDLLERTYGRIDASSFIATRVRSKSLFEFIIAVLLSQNTSDRNAIRAYRNLKRLLKEISPEEVLEAGFDKIVDAIRVAGMYKYRARVIIELARLFKDKGFVDRLTMDLEVSNVESARKKLLSLPGIGVKTADVVLLMYFSKPVFPVDTHIKRITYRLGVVSKKDYETIRMFWEKVLDKKDYLKTHLLLITHGRKTCKARNPLCNKCVLSKWCLKVL